jgi:hypothetical protein
MEAVAVIFWLVSAATSETTGCWSWRLRSSSSGWRRRPHSGEQDIARGDRGRRRWSGSGIHKLDSKLDIVLAGTSMSATWAA